jgi:hypothetical protein
MTLMARGRAPRSRVVLVLIDERDQVEAEPRLA